MKLRPALTGMCERAIGNLALRWNWWCGRSRLGPLASAVVVSAATAIGGRDGQKNPIRCRRSGPLNRTKARDDRCGNRDRSSRTERHRQLLWDQNVGVERLWDWWKRERNRCRAWPGGRQGLWAVRRKPNLVLLHSLDFQRPPPKRVGPKRERKQCRWLWTCEYVVNPRTRVVSAVCGNCCCHPYFPLRLDRLSLPPLCRLIWFC